MALRDKFGWKVFNVFNILILILVSLSILLPFLHVIAESLSPTNDISLGKVTIWPTHTNIANYAYVLNNQSILRAFGVTVYITVLGTILSLVATASLAYPVSREEFLGRKFINLMVLFTMIFSAPLIPTYLVIKNLGMIDTLWSLMIPGLITAFNFIVMRSFFEQIPASLIDSARIDGCLEMGILFKIVMPLSKPILATMAIFYGVSIWNSFKDALYYINTPSLYPLTVKLQQMIMTDQVSSNSDSVSAAAQLSPEGVTMATVIVATIPILLLYPFLQKHFTKGVMIGSVKE